MKKKFFLSFIIIVLFLLFGFIYIYSNDNLKFKFEYELYNNISYDNGKKIKAKIPFDNNVTYVKEKDLESVLTSGDRVIYFGYTTCPWCRNIVSPLVEVINDNNLDKLYYVDVHSVNAKSVYDILDEYLEFDNDGNKRLYVPDVYFIKDGRIVYHHLGSLDSYKDAFKGMNNKQLNELKSIYQEGIDLILGKEE